MGSEVLLLGRDLELRFGDLEVLRKVSIDLHRGESVGLVGPSGSGKTSLMMVLAGLERLSSGRIEVEGEDITGFDEDRLTLFRRENIGIVFQHFHLMGNMTALENVMLPLSLLGDLEAEEKSRDGLIKVGLGERQDHYPKELSGGEQQRVAIARAFAGNRKFIFADEPTGNLDEETGHMIRDMIFENAEFYQTSVLLITHDMDLVAHCDRVVIMRDGRLIERSN